MDVGGLGTMFGFVATSLVTGVGAWIAARRKMSRDGVELTKDRAEIDIIDNLTKQRDISEAKCQEMEAKRDAAFLERDNAINEKNSLINTVTDLNNKINFLNMYVKQLQSSLERTKRELERIVRNNQPPNP